jgi:alpha-galactosidase
MKVVMIGGGSYAWTHWLVGDFLLEGFFDGAELCLMDINAHSLEQVHAFCQTLTEFSEVKLKITRTVNLAEALSGADYVIVAVSIGGLEPELEDHRISRKYGYGNLKGSEAGPAGCSRTIRHVPYFVHLARQMEKLCPKAWLLNVTNPLTAITRSVNKYSSIRCVGFCHGVVNHLQALLPVLGAGSMDELDFITSGIDHCSWLLDMKVRGQDGFAILRKSGAIEAAYRGETLSAADDPFTGREEERLRFVIWNELGYLPAISDLHICEFLPQFMKTQELRSHWKLAYDRIKKRQAMVRDARENLQSLIHGQQPLSLRPSGEVIARFISALHGRTELVDVLNSPNTGQVPNLPNESIVETRCVVNASGIQGLSTGPLPPLIKSIVEPALIRQELYMEAACEWNKQKASAALSTDPIVNDFRHSRAMVDEIFGLAEKSLQAIDIAPRSWQYKTSTSTSISKRNKHESNPNIDLGPNGADRSGGPTHFNADRHAYR